MGLGIQGWGIIIMVIAVGGYIGKLNFDVWNLERKLDAAELEVQTHKLAVEFQKGEVKECRATIAESNNRINDLKEVANSREGILEALSENIDMFREVSESRIKDIANTPAPQTCELAMQFLRNGVGKQ